VSPRADVLTDLIEFGDPVEPQTQVKVQPHKVLHDDLMTLLSPPRDSASFSARDFVHSHLRVPKSRRCVGFHQNEDLIFAFQERLCMIIDVEVKTDGGKQIRVFPTKLNEFAHRGVVIADEDLIGENAKPQKRRPLSKTPTRSLRSPRASPTRGPLQDRGTRWNIALSKGADQGGGSSVEHSAISRHAQAPERRLSPRRAAGRKADPANFAVKDVQRELPLSMQESPVVPRAAPKQNPLALALVPADTSEDSF
jgi:hypothetical protein